jgi:Flp pilus assembly protein TadD
VADAQAGQAHRTRTVSDVQASISALEQALALWPTQPVYHEHLSWLHLQLAQGGYNSHAEFRSAEAALDTARRLTPDNYRTWAGLGELYTEWGQASDPTRFAQAERTYHQATTLFPGSAMLHTGWGLSYLVQGRIMEATDQFHQAAHLDHTDAWAYWRLGDALLAQDDLTGAEQAYHNALRWAPDLRRSTPGTWTSTSGEDNLKPHCLHTRPP